MSLARSIPSIVAGSAAAGFGLGFGRDLYRGTKRNLGTLGVLVGIVAFLVLPVVGIFIALRALALNYEARRGAVRSRAQALLLLLLSLVVGAAPLLYLGNVIVALTTGPNAFPAPSGGPLYAAEYWTFFPTQWVLGATYPMGGSLIGGSSVPVKWAIIAASAACGLAAGLASRRARRRMFDAVAHNHRFLDEVGLEEVGEGEFQDADGQHYRIDDRSARQVALFPIGRRNRRGFLDVDQDGRFTNWSGLVKV